MSNYKLKAEFQIEARQFLDGDPNHVTDWLVSFNKSASRLLDDAQQIIGLRFFSAEGMVTATDGDWVALPQGGSADDFEVFPDDDFQQTFDLIPDPPADPAVP